jgi:adenosylcobinamide kinase/adenosylcobinamide-phosphate guanylyltransferase
VTYLSPGVTLVLGGARSGKSAFAEGLVAGSGLAPVYVATGRAWDGEMEARVAAHKARRGETWSTVEAPLDLAQAVAREAREGRAVLADCLTLWVTNLMMEERDMNSAFDALGAAARNAGGPVVFVTNEVGLGIVPDNAMARAFRDHAGRLHQRIAAIAAEVYFVAAGLPLKMKG